MEVSKEALEQVFQDFADKICERHGIHFFNGGYVIHLEEEMLPDIVIVAGNPVVIKLHMRVFAEAFLKRNLIAVKHALQHALEVGSKRMLHTLSQNPAAPVISKDITDKQWVKRKTSDKVLPTLLPLDRLTFATKLIVSVTDKITGEYWIESGYAHKHRVEELERRAHANLSKLILGDIQDDSQTQGQADKGDTTPDQV